MRACLTTFFAVCQGDSVLQSVRILARREDFLAWCRAPTFLSARSRASAKADKNVGAPWLRPCRAAPIASLRFIQTIPAAAPANATGASDRRKVDLSQRKQ